MPDADAGDRGPTHHQRLELNAHPSNTHRLEGPGERVVRSRPAAHRPAAAGTAALLGVVLLVLASCSTQPPPAAWPPSAGRGPCAVDRTANVPVPMRDGTILRADVYRPRSQTPVPVILYRTQYNKTDAQVSGQRFQSPDWFASHCYLVVTQDIRGLYASDGTFSEFTHDQSDGYDSVEWAARLPGSTGKVGMYGSSYVGATQWLAAETAPPHLTTIVPTNTASDYDEGWTYEGGAFRANFVEPWAMSDLAVASAKHRGDLATAAQITADTKNIASWIHASPYDRFPAMHPGDPNVAPWFFDWIAHPGPGPYWTQWAPNTHYGQMNLPVLDMEGWYDAFLAGGLQNFTGMVSGAPTPAARANQRIVIGPYDHIGWGRPGSTEAPLLKAISPAANSPVNDLMLSWWDHYLKGVDNGVGTSPTGGPGPRVDYFRMGDNTWHASSAWPLPGTVTTPLLLGSGGHANTGGGDGTLTSAPGGATPDGFTYDPRDPVPSVGGHSCCGVTSPVASQGPYDQRQVETRPDVLAYTAAPFATATEVTGPIQVDLWATSSAPSTDWTAKLVVVHPDGSAINLNNGIQRTPTVPGQPTPTTISVWPTSYLFRPGDRLRLEVSSSDFPQFDPNPGTGATAATTDVVATARPSHQSVLHDPQHPSTLLLPVLPAAAQTPAEARPWSRGADVPAGK